MPKTKENRGITLVALVVTIIILLILAGISISALTGNYSLINQAGNAKEQSEIDSEKELIEMAIVQAMGENKYGNIEEDNLRENLDNLYNKEYELTEYGDIFILKNLDNEREYIIDNDGNIEIKKGIIATEIANSENKSDYYGQEVIYTVNNSNIQSVIEDEEITWKIFYVGTVGELTENNIYLIASDYIPSEICPSSSNYTVVAGTSNYMLSMSKVYQDYNGSNDITDTKLQALNNSFFTYLSKNNTLSTNANMKDVAYMMDTSLWNIFKGTGAEFAIGGPTVEMLVKSYSEKYEVDYQAQCSSAIGYELSKDGGKNWSEGLNALDKTDNLYVISSGKAEGMFLASPAPSEYYIYTVRFDGVIYAYSWAIRDKGFRPIICLSSDTCLEELEDGTYSIVE